MHQGLLGVTDRFLYSLQLLSNFKAATTSLKHCENTIKVALSPFEPFDYIRVGCTFSHYVAMLSSWRGYINPYYYRKMQIIVDTDNKKSENPTV